MRPRRSTARPQTQLLSSGTVESIDALIIELGYAGAQRVDVAPLGVEELGTWINAISPILLLIGIIGLYIEFKTAGFGVFGAVGIAALVLYFFGGYVSGMAGIEWVGIFVVGVALVAVELFLLPGTIFIGLIGVVCMFLALVMGMTDLYPNMPWFPAGEGEGGGGVVPQDRGHRLCDAGLLPADPRPADCLRPVGADHLGACQVFAAHSPLRRVYLQRPPAGSSRSPPSPPSSSRALAKPAQAPCR